VNAVATSVHIITGRRDKWPKCLSDKIQKRTLVAQGILT